MTDSVKAAAWMCLAPGVRGAIFQDIDVWHVSNELDAAIALGRDALRSPHDRARLDMLLLECAGPASALVEVARDPKTHDAPQFIRDFLAALVIELARRTEAIR